MDNTAIQAATPPSANGRSTAVKAEAPKPASPRPQRAPKSLPWRALERVASLRITVTLFALSLVLVFYGTLAQADKGIWTVVAEYFRGFGVLIPLNVVFLKPILRFKGDLPGFVPFPGGWLLGSCLLVNLLAAHIVSFKLSWRRTGIVVLHAGVVVMMLGEIVTGLCAVESHMRIDEHSSSSFVEQSLTPELAIVDASNLQKDQVTVIPAEMLRKGGVIADPALPFDVEVREYMVNSAMFVGRPQTSHGQGRHFKAEARPEGAGVDKNQKVDAASVIATLKRRDTGAPLGTYLFSLHLDHPDWVAVDGKTYQVNLRFKRVYKDYTFRLDKLNVKYYPGTSKPKDFSSYIHLTDPTQHEDRDIRIYMNNPFSYQGETFYQSGVDESPGRPRSTTLQVVHNPGWMLPYLSCFMVAGGMLFHFSLNLYRFVERRVL